MIQRAPYLPSYHRKQRSNMPLASSREASRKRPPSLSNVQPKNKRRSSITSHPETAKSSTFADPDKVARRKQSLSRQNSFQSLKENVGPGPTPYYQVSPRRMSRRLSRTCRISLLMTCLFSRQVAEERGGQMSPRLTRSAKKSKLPPAGPKAGGLILHFSPTDPAKLKQMDLENEMQL